MPLWAISVFTFLIVSALLGFPSRYRDVVRVPRHNKKTANYYTRKGYEIAGDPHTNEYIFRDDGGFRRITLDFFRWLLFRWAGRDIIY